MRSERSAAHDCVHGKRRRLDTVLGKRHQAGVQEYKRIYLTPRGEEAKETGARGSSALFEAPSSLLFQVLYGPPTCATSSRASREQRVSCQPTHARARLFTFTCTRVHVV